MENAVDAIKLAFSVIVFLMALVLTLSLIGQVRATSDIIFHFNDKTEFYQYATEDNIENVKDRIVGIETVIPTIHRYAKEQYAVTIFTTDGTPIVRYDLWTEALMANWKPGNDYSEVEERLERVQAMVNKTLGVNKSFGMDELEDLYKVESTANSNIKVGAPWIGEDNEILKRIQCDMVGSPYTYNMISYQGKRLSQYKARKFKEKFLEISTSGTTITDEEDYIETVKGNKKLEIIYILQ